LDLRLKPEMKLVMDRIYRQLDLLAREEERLRLEFIK
jgi:hypothetical protein